MTLTPEDRRIVYRRLALAIAWAIYGADTDRDYALMLRRTRRHG